MSDAWTIRKEIMQSKYGYTEDCDRKSNLNKLVIAQSKSQMIETVYIKK